jgi:hypothetical protein
MKTRKELYAKEAMEILRVISYYKALYTEQVVNLFPGREKKASEVIKILNRQGRIHLCQAGEMLKVTADAEPDEGLLKAFRVLLDFIERVEYHCAGEYPITLSFFLDSEFYEVIYVVPGQEALINHTVAENSEDMGKRIIIIDDIKQIEGINIPGTSGYCTVSEDGTVQYFKKDEVQYD